MENDFQKRIREEAEKRQLESMFSGSWDEDSIDPEDRSIISSDEEKMTDEEKKIFEEIEKKETELSLKEKRVEFFLEKDKRMEDKERMALKAELENIQLKRQEIDIQKIEFSRDREKEIERKEALNEKIYLKKLELELAKKELSRDSAEMKRTVEALEKELNKVTTAYENHKSQHERLKPPVLGDPHESVDKYVKSRLALRELEVEKIRAEAALASFYGNTEKMESFKKEIIEKERMSEIEKAEIQRIDAARKEEVAEKEKQPAETANQSHPPAQRERQPYIEPWRPSQEYLGASEKYLQNVVGIGLNRVFQSKDFKEAVDAVCLNKVLEYEQKHGVKLHLNADDVEKFRKAVINEYKEVRGLENSTSWGNSIYQKLYPMRAQRELSTMQFKLQQAKAAQERILHYSITEKSTSAFPSERAWGYHGV